MPVEIIVRGANADDFATEMRSIAAIFSPTYAHRETPIETQTFGSLPGDAAQGPLPAAEKMPEPSVARRGRPRKDDTTATAAPPVVETPAASEPVKAPDVVFRVRRFGGRIEGEYPDSGTATEVLIGLIHEAGDIEALKALVGANAGEVESWPTERTVAIGEAIAAAEAAIAAKTAKPDAPVVYGGPHLDTEGKPLAALTLDKKGALNGVNAVVAASGGGGGPGFLAAQEYMLSLDGMKRVSAVDDTDPRLAKLARWCAERLALPVVEAAPVGGGLA